ncbi:MAG TPA: glutaredoxin domain-containing protein [Sandaracinaceae bacterium]
MAEVQIYVTRTCPYCVAARRLFDAKGIAYELIDVTGDAHTRAWLRDVTGRHTVPQIFIDGRPYGGYTDVAALDRFGELDRLLGIV